MAAIDAVTEDLLSNVGRFRMSGNECWGKKLPDKRNDLSGNSTFWFNFIISLFLFIICGDFIEKPNIQDGTIPLTENDETLIIALIFGGRPDIVWRSGQPG